MAFFDGVSRRPNLEGSPIDNMNHFIDSVIYVAGASSNESDHYALRYA